MTERLELRWPGKYDAQGHRVPVPRPGATLRVETTYPPESESELEPEPASEFEPDSEPEPASEFEPEPASEPEPWRNRLIEGDNLAALDALVRDHGGTVDLVYLDPPFATGGRFDVVSPVGPRPPRGAGRGAVVRQPAYTDRWPGGVDGLIAMLDPRLRLVHELLAPHGSLYLHVDPTVGHAVKLLLDEVFGPGCFQREIVWRIGWVSGFKTRARNWIRNHDLLFFYVKDSERFTFNKRYLPHPPGYRRRDGSPPRGKGVPLDDVWNAGDVELGLRGAQSLDSIQIKSFSTEKTGYATQKNESVLRRIVEASSNPGDLVADVFCGSGTTLAVAERLGRRWIGCDAGRSAVHITTARLLGAPRRRSFEVCTVEVPSPSAEPPPSVVSRAQAAWDALCGPADAALRVVGTQREEPPVGRGAPAVAAWRWSTPLPIEDQRGRCRVGEPPPERGGHPVTPRATPLVLRRERPGAGGAPAGEGMLYERARPWILLHDVAAGPLTVELGGLVHHHPSWLPEVLRAPTWGPLDLIEWWSVTWDEREPAPVDVVLGRFGRDRRLPPRSPPHGYEGRDARLVVRVHDVLHREHRVVCRLVRRRGRWRVVEARAETEG